METGMHISYEFTSENSFGRTIRPAPAGGRGVEHTSIRSSTLRWKVMRIYKTNRKSKQTNKQQTPHKLKANETSYATCLSSNEETNSFTSATHITSNTKIVFTNLPFFSRPK
jgi:hypothetical protein